MKLFYTLYWCLFFFSEVNVSVRKYTKVGLHPAIYRMSIVSPGISAPFEINESFATGFERVRVWFWISSILMDRRKLYPLSATPCRRYFVGRRFRVQPWKYNLFTVLFFLKWGVILIMYETRRQLDITESFQEETEQKLEVFYLKMKC